VNLEGIREEAAVSLFMSNGCGLRLLRERIEIHEQDSKIARAIASSVSFVPGST